MVIDRRKAILFASAAALRLVLFFAFPSLPILLTGRVEISTPVTSFKRCKPFVPYHCLPLMTDILQCKKVSSFTPTMSLPMMGASITRHVPLAEHESPHPANRFSQAPLLLPLFAIIPSSLFSPLTALIYIVLDLLCANALIRITESGESGSSRLFTSPRKDMKWDSIAVAAA